MLLAARIALTAVSVAQTHSELYPGLATLAASEPELHGNDGFFLEAADSADSDGDGATVCTMLRAHLRLFPWQAHVWARLGVCQVKADVPLVATRRSEAHPLRMSRQAAEACADLDGEPLPLTRQAAFDLYTSAAEEQGPAPARASCATTPVERRALERLRESEAALELAEWLGGAASATAAREAVLSLLAPPRLCATDAQALADGGTALVRAAIAALADPDRLTAPGGPFRKLCTVPNLVVRVEGSGPSATSLRLALAGLRVCGVVTLVSDPPMSGAALERLQASVDAEFAVESGSCRGDGDVCLAASADSVTDRLAPRDRGRLELKLPARPPFVLDAPIGGGPSALRQVVGLMLRHRHVELDTFSVVRASPGSADQVWHMDVDDLFRDDANFHRDAAGANLPPAGLVAMVPLTSLELGNGSNGPTEFIPGSHLRYSLGGAGESGMWWPSAVDLLNGRPVDPAVQASLSGRRSAAKG